MRAWRTHEYGPRPTEVLKLDARVDPRAVYEAPERNVGSGRPRRWETVRVR